MDNCPICIKSVLKHAKKLNVYYVIPITTWNVLFLIAENNWGIICKFVQPIWT